MKRILLLILIMVLSVLPLAGCGSDPQESADESETIKIVASIFPEYDWARIILGDNPAGAELILLTDNGVDLHSFQPAVEDIYNIDTCDVLLYVGGESDSFIGDALENAANDNMIVVDLLEAAGGYIKEEELAEGMEAEEEGEEDETEYDEHIWLSLKAAPELMGAICDAISKADPINEAYYRSNLEAYTAELEALDKEFEKTVSEAKVKTLLFGDRFPFRYMADDYGINYYAAFAGCSSETDASFETITFLAGKADELSLNSILIIDNSDGRIAKAIKDITESKDQNILTLNSMQAVASEDIEAGASYISIMRSNLEVLKEALN